MSAPPSAARRGRGLPVLAAAGLVSGCLGTLPQGESGLQAEFDRLRGDGPFHFVERGPDHAVVMAEGRRIRLAPVPGLCLAEEGFEQSARGAFAAVADCVADGIESAEGQETVALPPSFPGLVTISVAGEPMFAADQGKATSLRLLRDFLGSAPGLKLLGRNGSGEGVRLVETRQVGEGLYVRVEDSRPDRLALFSSEFWRAFVEINGRLVLVTVSGFADRPVRSDPMLAVLAAQVSRLREENGAPLFDEEMRLAAAVDGSFDIARVRVTDPSAGIEALRGRIEGTAPARAPAPPERQTADAGPAATGPAGAGAPSRAPLAPQRPRRG